MYTIGRKEQHKGGRGRAREEKVSVVRALGKERGEGILHCDLILFL